MALSTSSLNLRNRSLVTSAMVSVISYLSLPSSWTGSIKSMVNRSVNQTVISSKPCEFHDVTMQSTTGVQFLNWVSGVKCIWYKDTQRNVISVRKHQENEKMYLYKNKNTKMIVSRTTTVRMIGVFISTVATSSDYFRTKLFGNIAMLFFR